MLHFCMNKIKLVKNNKFTFVEWMKVALYIFAVYFAIDVENFT